tara:strand:+ start:95 stop:1003 length:909 start_codon:yes stop_codon:yes gene_type:complete
MLPNLQCLSIGVKYNYDKFKNGKHSAGARQAFGKLKSAVRRAGIPDGHVEPNCPICYEPFRGREVFIAECGHAMHVECAQRQRVQQNTCPVCRTPFTENELRELGLEALLPPSMQSIYVAMAEENYAPLIQAIDSGFNVDTQDEDDQTLLMWASSFGNDDAVLYLISSGASMNIRDSWGQTALMNAASEGFEDIANELLDHGAERDLQDSYGWTAFYHAVNKGAPEVVNVLLHYGANPTIATNEGVTPLQFAMKKNADPIVPIARKLLYQRIIRLIENGPDDQGEFIPYEPSSPIHGPSGPY